MIINLAPSHFILKDFEYGPQSLHLKFLIRASFLMHHFSICPYIVCSHILEQISKDTQMSLQYHLKHFLQVFSWSEIVS